jgi:hypothetical protein
VLRHTTDSVEDATEVDNDDNEAGSQNT